MKARSSTDASPRAVRSASTVSTCLARPISAAMSPPGRTCRYWCASRVDWSVIMASGSCGLRNSISPLLAHRVEDDDLAAAAGALLQGMQEARAVGAGVLAEVEDRIARVEILEHAGAHRRADHLLQPHRRGLVAHVRAVGQVVVPVHAAEQRIQVRRLEAGPARGVEDHRAGIELAQAAADGGEGFAPGGAHILVGLRGS